MKNKYGFILIKPQLGENIGASARALKNFGFKDLIITEPRAGWPNIKAKQLQLAHMMFLLKQKYLTILVKQLKNLILFFHLAQEKET